MARRAAFTLVELSVVLVIIGLLVGGIIAGQNLMRAQSLRTVLQDAKTYAIAKQLFADKYGALPGDMPDAIRVWGNADGNISTAANCASPTTDQSVGTLTCNGDGNGIISDALGEKYRAWQHLSAAGMISGRFTGIHGPDGADHAIAGTNVPTGPLTNSGYAFYSWGERGNDTQFYAGNYDNVIVFGGITVGGWPSGAVLTGAEAYEIDKKVDDALPAYGTIRTRMSSWLADNTGTCVTSDTPGDAAYIRMSASPTCFILFLRGFQAKPE